ncbi:MAG: transcriptional regulator [Beggiatoa sp. IS2]|nr:MAG: transcriptional regulator [Beggiatoa sp. IS2]
MTAHILVVDDEPDIRGLLKEILEDEGFTISVAENGQAARQFQREQHPDLVLLDIWMPDIDGISLLKEWRENGLMDNTVIMMSGHGTVETAVEATRLGAYDFIEKPLSIAKLLITINRALEMASLQRENYGLRKHAQTTLEPLGHSAIMTAIREQVKRINQHDTAVLISGEAGSGRTLFARYIHQNSLRREGPFVHVRVAGMSPENQILELFGSQGNSLARLEQANKGTLFIRDIADLDDAVQARLLSSLENQSFSHNGGTETIPINVRIIAATYYEPDQAVKIGHLREDLYYYLNIVPLNIPPLREHCEDIPELLDFYVNLFVNQENLPYRRFTVAAQNRLRNYLWPGNVRELKNLVQRLLLLGNGQTIDAVEVEPSLNVQHRPTTTHLSIYDLPFYDLPLREAREQFEKAYLEHQLQEVGGNVSKVASKVGLERTHLYRKLRALDIDPKQTKK